MMNSAHQRRDDGEEKETEEGQGEEGAGIGAGAGAATAEGCVGGEEEEAESEFSSSSSSPAPPRRLDASDGDEEDEESMAGTVLHVSLHIPHLISPRKAPSFSLWRTFRYIFFSSSVLLNSQISKCCQTWFSSAPSRLARVL